jgi:HlyD family secretion protein
MFSRKGLLQDAIPFQDPIDELCEQLPPPFLRATHYLVVGLFAALLLIAALTRLDVVVVAAGRLATATPPIVLQPMDRVIVRELHVRPGDVVTKGQVLATLDPTFVKADAAALEKQERMLQAEVRRLEGEADALPFDISTLSTEDDQLQDKLLRQRQAEYAMRLRVFDEDIRRLRASLRTLNGGRGSLNRELDVAKEVERMRSELVHSQNGSRLNLLEAQANRMRVERNQEEATNRLEELRYSVESREAERQSFVEEWRRELLEKLVNARGELTRVVAAQTKASRLHDLVVMTAPTDGVILYVAPRTEGSVLREAEPLLTIVPKNAPLIAGDTGYTLPGAEAQLKIDAFPYQLHGMIAGRLQSVSEESLAGGVAADAPAGGRGSAFHRGRVELSDTRLEHVVGGARLFPGMTLTAEIKAGTRSVLSYFLYPLTRGLRESLREP